MEGGVNTQFVFISGQNERNRANMSDFAGGSTHSVMVSNTNSVNS